MEAISLLHFVLRWLLVLIGAGGWLWLAAMLLALTGWTLWGACHVSAWISRSLISSGRRRRAMVVREQHASALTPISR